ncbi:MAG: hypothetical protein QX198_01395, partial [Methylococcaceae bacterium]
MSRSPRFLLVFILLMGGILSLFSFQSVDAEKLMVDINNAVVNIDFSPDHIVNNGVSRLRVTISNPNEFALNAAAFTDNLPTGLTIASPPGVTTDCADLNLDPTVVSAVAGSATLGLVGGVVPAAVPGTPGSCTVSVNVVADGGGIYSNWLAA